MSLAPRPIALMAIAVLLGGGARTVVAQGAPPVGAHAAPRDLRHPSTRMVGQWLDQRGTVWYIGAHDDHEEGVLHVVRSNSVRTRWKYRILEESNDTHLVLFVMEPNNSTRELVLTVPLDGKAITVARRATHGVTFAEADSLRYQGTKSRPDR